VLEQRRPDEGDELIAATTSSGVLPRPAIAPPGSSSIVLRSKSSTHVKNSRNWRRLAAPTAAAPKFCAACVAVRIDYSRITELWGVDLEPYRKKPVEVVRINLSSAPSVSQNPAGPNLPEPLYE